MSRTQRSIALANRRGIRDGPKEPKNRNAADENKCNNNDRDKLGFD